MAHAYLEPLTDGSVALLKPGRPRTSPEKLNGKIEKLKNLTLELRRLSKELTNLNIPVPTGWMSMDTYQPRRTSFVPPGLGSGFAYTPLPPKTTDQQEQD
jgi:hypothetical protein